MRRVSAWVTGVLVGAIGLALASAAATGATGANLNGRFSVAETTTYVNGIVRDYVGRAYTYSWTLVPACQVGSCATGLTSSSGLRFQLTPAGAGFVGSTTLSADCVSTSPPYQVVVANGESETVTLRLKPADVVDGAAHQLTGSLTYRYNPTAAGRARNCHPGVEIRSATATALPGTVKSAIPPAPRHRAAAGARRSTIASSLVPIGRAFAWRLSTLWDALFTLLAMLLITFPAQVFNRTLDENYEEIKQILATRAPRLARMRRRGRSLVARSPLATFAIVLLGGAIIGGFNDPTFGLNASSVRTLVAVLVSFLLGIATAATVGWLYRRARGLERAARPRALPEGLAVAVVCVVVSRLSHFEPGYLYGVVAGVSFSSRLGRREQGHEVALSSLATLVVALVAWVVWTPVEHAARGAHPGAIVLTADTLLAGLFVMGVVNTVINLIPVESLPGRLLFRWHRGAWAATFLVSVFLLIDVMLLPAARAHRETSAPIIVTTVLFAVFAALSIGFNRYFAWRHRRPPRDLVDVPARRPQDEPTG